MARRRILALRYFTCAAVPAGRHCMILESRRYAAGREAACLAKAEPDEIWHPKRTFPPRSVGFAVCAGLGNVTDRIRALVAELTSVGCCADADRVEDKEERAHMATTMWALPPPAWWSDVGFECGQNIARSCGHRNPQTPRARAARWYDVRQCPDAPA